MPRMDYSSIAHGDDCRQLRAAYSALRTAMGELREAKEKCEQLEKCAEQDSDRIAKLWEERDALQSRSVEMAADYKTWRASALAHMKRADKAELERDNARIWARRGWRLLADWGILCDRCGYPAYPDDVHCRKCGRVFG